MKFTPCTAAAGVAASFFSSVSAQTRSSTWCGKNFMPNQTVVLPGGQFQLPVSSNEPLVAFRCAPVFRPYLEEDAKHAAFVIDTPIVYQYIQGASPIALPNDLVECDDLGVLDVQISIENHTFARQKVPLNVTGCGISVDISFLSAQKTSYDVTCLATYHSEATSSSTTQYFSANTSLLYLPDTDGSVVKTDLRTGALWVRAADGQGGDFEPFVPQGFYVSFDQNLAKNLSLIDRLKSEGFNTIHPIPPYDNTTVFEQVLARTAELGLYFVYDMRSSYQNLTAVAEQVKAYGSLPNLLVWETAHEPDGNSDPFDAPHKAYHTIYELDGYHPVSIVLNCEDYNFSPYVQGADVVLEDAYPVGINATFSPIWHTECTPDFGHCGCDDCTGSIRDITARIQSYKDRLNILGYDRSKTVWTTPQAIGSGAYWSTTPTGTQWAAMGLTSFSHGATGSISFQYPTTTGNGTTIEGTAAHFTGVIAETVQPFLVDPEATHEVLSVGGVDVGVWHNDRGCLLLVTNFNVSDVYMSWADVGLGEVRDVMQMFTVGQEATATGFHSIPGGIGIYTATLTT